jgi:hypothetical protein
MKEITLSLAHYKAIQSEQGEAAAVEAIRSDIQKLGTDFPIELELNGPNPDGDKVTSLRFVRAASWNAVRKEFKVNLLTCGFAANDDASIADLFTALTNPQVPVTIHPEHLAEGEEEPHVQEKVVIGLIVGSHTHPLAFITFEA